MRGDGDYLFSRGTLDEALRAQKASIADKIESVDKNRFLATPEQDLVNNFVDALWVEPLELHEDAMFMEQEECEANVAGEFDRDLEHHRGPFHVPGVRVVVSVPYTGDPELWSLRSNPGSMNPPRAAITRPVGDDPGLVKISMAQASDRGQEAIQEQFRQTIDQALSAIRTTIERQRSQIERYQAELEPAVRRSIEQRRQRLEANEGIARSLSIPLKCRGGVPDINPITVKRKLVRPLPAPPKSAFEPEPGISEEQYEHILGVIRHECRSFERTSGTFSRFDEEGLRDVLLAHLNGHYEGDATGETFNRAGKTDIRLAERERAAFIAECKIWTGQKALRDAVDQLLGYLTWRDCKAALVIFNKHNAGFADILEKIPGTLKEHGHFKRLVDESQGAHGEWRYVFRSQEDELREVTVHVFAVNIYFVCTK